LEEIMTGYMTRRHAADVLAAVSCLLAGAAAQAKNSVKLGYAISKTGPNTGGASRRSRYEPRHTFNLPIELNAEQLT
jgi:hypothetical protein